MISWKNEIGPDVSIDGVINKTYFQNLNQTLASPHSNQLSVKFIYFVDYNRLRKKKTA